MTRRAQHPRPARARGAAALTGALGMLAACSGPPGAGRQLGDDLGGFHVAATELANGCGAGALGSRPSFEFEIDLARESTQIFWGRDASGSLDAQLGFEFSATVRVPIGQRNATANNGNAASNGNATANDGNAASNGNATANDGNATGSGCTIGRADHIAGTLQADAAGEVIGFSARLTYSFEPAPDSSCSLDDRIGAGLPHLPCEMDYALAADRTRTPD